MTYTEKEKIEFFRDCYGYICENYSCSYRLHFNRHLKGYSFTIIPPTGIRPIKRIETSDCVGKPIVFECVDFGLTYGYYVPEYKFSYSDDYILKGFYESVDIKYDLKIGRDEHYKQFEITNKTI